MGADFNFMIMRRYQEEYSSAIGINGFDGRNTSAYIGCNNGTQFGNNYLSGWSSQAGYAMEGNTKDEKIVADLSTTGLEYMGGHFLPQHNTWSRDGQYMGTTT